MKSRRKTFYTALCVSLVTFAIVQLRGAPVSESCRVFREQMRELATNDSGFAGVIAVVPEQAMTKALQVRYGTLTDKECRALLPDASAGLEALIHTPWASLMPQAAAQATQAVNQCVAKRMQGELKTHAESVQCSNPQITQAFIGIGYPYKDLVTQFTDKRLEEATRIDQSFFGGGQEDPEAFATLALNIAEQERARIQGRK